MKHWTALVLLMFSIVAHADDTLDITKPSVNPVLKRLATTDVFAFGPVGFFGTTSQGEADFNIIMRQEPKAAMEALEKLYAQGHAQAKSYALVGIRKLDGRRFHELLTTLQTPDEVVKTQGGCMVGHNSLRGIAEQIKRGAYDRWRPASKTKTVLR